tara:strand:- start:1957 stop:2505 length:549 start_codon:yes stop_codon:yes gene_type:complete
MASKNIKTSKIKFIEDYPKEDKDSTWSNGDHTYLKYKLHLENGEKPEFLAKKQETIDSYNIGDEVKYSYKKEGQIFAKIEKEFNQKSNYNTMANNNNNTNNTASSSGAMSQQESIARSVGWNNVVALVCSAEFQEHSDLSEVKFDKSGAMTGPVFSDRQKFMLNQCASAANIIFKELITKPN